MNVARAEPTGRREAPPDDRLRETPGSADASRIPDCAEFIIGRAIRATRWLHPGYQFGADLAEKLL